MKIAVEVSMRWVVSGYPALLAMFIGTLSAPAGMAQEVYRAVGEDGVASFTDFPVSGAERVEVMPIAADPERAQASRDLVAQQLAVAKALEDSRLARLQAETERMKARAASQPQTVYYEVPRQTSYGSWGWQGNYWGNRPRHRPGHRPGYRPGRPHQPIVPGHPNRPGQPNRPGGPGGGDHGGRGQSQSKPLWMGK